MYYFFCFGKIAHLKHRVCIVPLFWQTSVFDNWKNCQCCPVSLFGHGFSCFRSGSQVVIHNPSRLESSITSFLNQGTSWMGERGAWDWSSHDFNLNIYLKGRESSKMTWKWLGQWVTKSPERLPGTTKKKKKKILISKHFPEIYLKGVFNQGIILSIMRHRLDKIHPKDQKLWWGQWPDQNHSSQKP